MSELNTTDALIGIFRSHFARYPAMQTGDAVKLCYQSAFGGGHLITDPARALARIRRERQEIKVYRNDLPLFEDIGNGMVRLNLNAAGAQALTDDVILRLFSSSAVRAAARRGNTERFENALSCLTALAETEECPFDADALSVYLLEYRAAGSPAVHHTEVYNDAYHPAYRVMEGVYAVLLPLITAIDALHPQQDAPVTVAIDGRAASGKSTLTEALSVLYDCNVFHMDDYFLPVSMRTGQRLTQPGGNVHYERFHTEILDGIRTGKPFSYRPYDCSLDACGAPVPVTPRPLHIIEGSYALHPYFGDAYDIRAAVTCEGETQLTRIRHRNGEPLYSMFVSRWIPMEEAYFRTYKIFEDPRTHIIYNN